MRLQTAQSFCGCEQQSLAARPSSQTTLHMTLVMAFLHMNFVLVSPHDSSMPCCPAARMGKQSASAPLMGMSVCAGMGMCPVIMAEPASRSTSAQHRRQICIRTAPVSAVPAMTSLALPTMSKSQLLLCALYIFRMADAVLGGTTVSCTLCMADGVHV